MKPACADWALWIGHECEGSESLGVKTLFIRSLASFPRISPKDDFAWLVTRTGCSRVWFCKEFKDWGLMRAIGRVFKERCVEVEPQCLLNIPADLRASSRLYLKVVLSSEQGPLLKPGDQVCVGLPFEDESFKIGNGNKVTPEMYVNDKRIA